MKSLPILYQDEHLIVVNKPAGLLVHRSALDKYATEFAMQIVRNQLNKWVYLLHRLDKSTSGVLMFALEKGIARRMTELWTGGDIAKTYLAIVRGYTKESERIGYPLREQWDKMTDKDVQRDKPAQDAVTEYTRLARIELPYPVGRYDTARFSLIKASPLTGRNHQIRRHLKHIFHPIIGDTIYGDGKQNEFFRTRFNCHRSLLHAHELAFRHPVTNAGIRITAPLDEVFGAVVNSLNWNGLMESQ